jgi:hypothetical protein
MAFRLPSFAPRVAAIALVLLVATAGLTYAAGSQLPSTPSTPAATVAAVPPVIVPDVRGQAYVFAKGTLEESGFAWNVVGSVQGYAANVVVAQSPAPGTQLVDTGSPLVTLTLKRNGSYAQVGEPESASPYAASIVQPAATANGLGPALPAAETTPDPAKTAPTKTAPTKTAPAKTTPATTTAAPAVAIPAKSSAPATAATPQAKAATKQAGWPQNRPAAFSVPGATKEPLDEMPLPNRATALVKWIEAHPTKTHANVQHWMFQHEWIVTGAKMGWWRGADALQTLVAADRRAQQLWGIGAKSAAVAEQALSDVRGRAKS